MWEEFKPLDPSLLAIPIYIVFIAIEAVLIATRRAAGDYEAKDAASSLTMGVISVAAGMLWQRTVLGLVIIGALTFAYQFRIFDLPMTWWVVVLCFLVEDFRYYWSHRIEHRMRLGWASHVVHHSSEHYNLTTALRQPWAGPLTGLFVLRMPVALLGFHPTLIAFVMGFNLIYQFFIHTETVRRLPAWIEFIFNTPSHHRVHHGRNPRYLDANYAGVFIIWDRIFGTFVREDDKEPVDYGLVAPLKSFNPLTIGIHEFIDIARDQMKPNQTWTSRFLYLFGEPGYSHDGSKMTSRQIQAAAGLDTSSAKAPPTPQEQMVS